MRGSHRAQPRPAMPPSAPAQPYRLGQDLELRRGQASPTSRPFLQVRCRRQLAARWPSPSRIAPLESRPLRAHVAFVCLNRSMHAPVLTEVFCREGQKRHATPVMHGHGRQGIHASALLSRRPRQPRPSRAEACALMQLVDHRLGKTLWWQPIGRAKFWIAAAHAADLSPATGPAAATSPLGTAAAGDGAAEGTCPADMVISAAQITAMMAAA